MPSFSVSPRQIAAIDQIVGADRIVSARIDGYSVVVPAGEYAVGDWVLYFPESSILPIPIIEQLGLTGRLAGADKNRVKAIRLRGQLSQGLVMRLPEWCEQDTSVDYSAALGVTKYAPVIPANFGGDLRVAPNLMGWCDIENIRKLRVAIPGEPIFDPFDGTDVSVTEKVHGTCFISTKTREGDVMVTSKGVGSRALALVESDRNVYWRAFRENGVEPLLDHILSEYPGADSASAYGEVYGAGIQDLSYGVGHSLTIFDVRAGSDWLRRDVWAPISILHGLVPVSELYRGPYDYERIWSLASGMNHAGIPGSNIMEGVVVRPTPERHHGGARLIAKFVSESYLLRDGGSEYE